MYKTQAFGFFIPGLSWTGFKDGIHASIGWLLLYSLPILPASAGAYAGGLVAKLISSIRKG